MPSKKGSKNGGKKKQARNSEEDAGDIETLDVQYSPEILTGILDDLQAQVETQCQQIQKDADFMATSIKQAFYLELIKLPKEVKQMSMEKFKQEYGDSLEAVTKGAMATKINNSKSNILGKSQIENRKDILSTAQKNIRSSARLGVCQTPMQSKEGGSSFIPETPSTQLRQPREGEYIVSANGSPLGEFNTVVKPKGGISIIPQTPGVYVPLSSGEIVDVENVDISALSQDAKMDAYNKMKDMMSSMQALMAKLEKPMGV